MIEQAKGVLAERGRLSMDAAFDRLRRWARRHNLRLSEVARQVVDTDLAAQLLADIEAPQPADAWPQAAQPAATRSAVNKTGCHRR
jgi:hypothetical protein